MLLRLFLPIIWVWWKCQVLVGYCTSLPSSKFSDIMMIPWNQSQWKFLHHQMNNCYKSRLYLLFSWLSSLTCKVQIIFYECSISWIWIWNFGRSHLWNHLRWWLFKREILVSKSQKLLSYYTDWLTDWTFLYIQVLLLVNAFVLVNTYTSELNIWLAHVLSPQ